MNPNPEPCKDPLSPPEQCLELEGCGEAGAVPLKGEGLIAAAQCSRPVLLLQRQQGQVQQHLGGREGGRGVGVWREKGGGQARGPAQHTINFASRNMTTRLYGHLGAAAAGG